MVGDEKKVDVFIVFFDRHRLKNFVDQFYGEPF